MLLAPMILALALSPSTSLPDDSANPALLLSLDDLHNRLDDPGLRLLDVRSRMDYEREHIPGAVHVDLRAFSAQAAMPGGLEDLDAWAKLLSPLGLARGQTVVIYEGRRQIDAARLWFLLHHLGVESVALLDGNFGLWSRETRPTDAKIPVIPPSSIQPILAPGWLATSKDIREAIESGTTSIVDARSDREFTGEEAISKRGGRIPSARQLEWSDLVDTEGRFRPDDDVRAVIEQAGIDLSRPAIAHCQGGGRAAVDTFLLRRLGVPARNYYLGWSEWGNDESCPIETGPAQPIARESAP